MSRTHTQRWISSGVSAAIALAGAALMYAGDARAQRAGRSGGGVSIRGTNGSVSHSYSGGGGGHYRGGRWRGGGSGGGSGGGGPVELALDVGYFSPWIADTSFHGESIQRGTPNYIAVDTTGRGLGFVQPAMFEAQAHLRWAIGPYFNLGVAGGVMGFGQYDRRPDDSASRAVVGDQSTLFGGSISGSAQFMIPLGLVTLRPGLMAGVRFWGVRAAQLESGSCSYTALDGHRHENETCSSSVGSVTAYIQPRMAIDFDTPGPLGIGAYMGVDVYPAWGFAAGLTFSIRTPPFGGGWYQTFAPPPPPPPPPVPVEQPLTPVEVEQVQQPAVAPPPPSVYTTPGTQVDVQVHVPSMTAP